MDESRERLKNEVTDLIDNKGSALGGMRNEPTVGEEKGAGRRVETGLPLFSSTFNVQQFGFLPANRSGDWPSITVARRATP